MGGVNDMRLRRTDGKVQLKVTNRIKHEGRSHQSTDQLTVVALGKRRQFENSNAAAEKCSRPSRR